jgi:AraC family ethanolamine operon transcriptional activator
MNFLLHSRFRDFCQFQAETRAWHLDFIQLDRGASDFRLLQAAIGICQITRVRLNRKLLQRGQCPAGMRTFVIPVNPDMSLEWLGQKVGGNDLLVFPEDGELSSRSNSDFDMITYSVPISELEQACENLGLPGLQELLGRASVLRLPPGAMTSLRQKALLCTRILEESDTGVPGGGFPELVGHEFTHALLSAISENKSDQFRTPSAQKRSACLRATLELIEDHGHESLSVRDICTRVRVSERTLQYAFKDSLGMSPKSYLQAWRLNQVRRKLCHPTSSSQTIADLANHYGFWHMGQFAADYRKIFGELPKETRYRVADRGVI